jgi:translation elongation factor aEF-1 beta
MPKTPETDLTKIESEAKKIIEADGSIYHKTEITPIAFGIKSVTMVFMRDESKGDVEPMEKDFAKIDDVESVDTVDVRRAFG